MYLVLKLHMNVILEISALLLDSFKSSHIRRFEFAGSSLLFYSVSQLEMHSPGLAPCPGDFKGSAFHYYARINGTVSRRRTVNSPLVVGALLRIYRVLMHTHTHGVRRSRPRTADTCHCDVRV